MNEKTLEEAITRALEQQPKAEVPVDFAARVRASLPAAPKAKASLMAGRSVSRTAAMVAVGGLVIALCALAPHVRPSFESVAFDMEMVLLVELCAVAGFLVRAGNRE